MDTTKRVHSVSLCLYVASKALTVLPNSWRHGCPSDPIHCGCPLTMELLRVGVITPRTSSEAIQKAAYGYWGDEYVNGFTEAVDAYPLDPSPRRPNDYRLGYDDGQRTVAALMACQLLR